jgi:hypothetical protein
LDKIKHGFKILAECGGICGVDDTYSFLLKNLKNFQKVCLPQEPNLQLFNKERMHGIMSSIAVDSVFKTINVCKNYTNNDAQITNFPNCRIKKKV